MDLVHTDPDGAPRGFVGAFTMDAAYGTDENDFEVTVDASLDVPVGGFVYEPGTDVGGIVRGSKLSTLEGITKRTITGRTWHGILGEHVIRPEDGEDYLTVSGDVNDCIHDALANMGIASAFEVAPTFGKSISYQFERYVDGYSGLCKMLSKHGMKLVMSMDGTKPTIGAASAGRYVDDGSTNSCGFRIVHDTPVNHLVCIGEGELSERAVVDLYVAPDGSVGTTQAHFGLDEVAQVYERTGSDEESLTEEGTKKLKELQAVNEATLELPEGVAFDIGDVVGVRDMEHGVSLVATVTKVIVKVDEYGNVDRTNEIGDVTEV